MEKSLEMNGLCAMKSLPQHPVGYKKQTSSNYSPAGKINKCFSCLSDRDCSMILATCETMRHPFNLTWKYKTFIKHSYYLCSHNSLVSCYDSLSDRILREERICYDMLQELCAEEEQEWSGNTFKHSKVKRKY